jgi:alkylhydroperoxidase/carboxymuconolactone decarboxylase family protein YurZ
MDPQAYEKFGELREYLHDDGLLPEKTKELLFLAMCCAIRFSPGTRGHAEKALAHGATRQEIFRILEMAILTAGVAAY